MADTVGTSTRSIGITTINRKRHWRNKQAAGERLWRPVSCLPLVGRSLDSGGGRPQDGSDGSPASWQPDLTMIPVTCTQCGRELSAPTDSLGKKVKCPHCAAVLAVPAAVPVAEVTSSPAAVLPATEQYGFLAPAQGPDEIGRLAAYRILRVLGAGGMGMVFLAEDTHLGRRVALKVMRPEAAGDARERRRFLREARAAAAVEHEHIVPLFAAGEQRGVLYLAMPYLQGETLEARMQREASLPLAEILRVGREVAEGLAAAHERGLIHRDIKPANIWLEARPGESGAAGEPGASAPGGRVKIIDFGLVQVAGDEQRLTRTGLVVGTPAYMSPEQARREATVDARCDLFSLGCVLYRLCTGRLPFEGESALSMLRALVQEHPLPICLVNLAMPAALSDLIEQLLAKRPEDRPANARAVVEALRAIEKGDVPAKPAPQDVPARRRAAVVVATAIFVALGLAGLLFGLRLLP
jgi:tRNA A-37 threonylcarbamoyl transferase component Bud32